MTLTRVCFTALHAAVGAIPGVLGAVPGVSISPGAAQEDAFLKQALSIFLTQSLRAEPLLESGSFIFTITIIYI